MISRVQRVRGRVHLMKLIAILIRSRHVCHALRGFWEEYFSKPEHRATSPCIPMATMHTSPSNLIARLRSFA